MKHFIWESGKANYHMRYFLLSVGPIDYSKNVVVGIMISHSLILTFNSIIFRYKMKYTYIVVYNYFYNNNLIIEYNITNIFIFILL